jgi:RNase P/RNase MRP subunit p29
MHTEYRTYRITMPGQFPGHRPSRLIRAKVVRETSKTIVLETAQGETIRRHKANVAEVQPQGSGSMRVMPLGYVGSYCPPAIGLKPDAPIGERVKAFADALRRMDWFYQMSDDHRVYQRGLYWEQELIQEFRALERIDPSLVVLAVAQSGCLERIDPAKWGNVNQ